MQRFLMQRAMPMATPLAKRSPFQLMQRNMAPAMISPAAGYTNPFMRLSLINK